MTGQDDFERRLGQFLEDGPARSPERPVELAIAHAQANPRGRDPFAIVRRDPMAARSGWSARPVLALAALGLFLVLSIGAFVAGSRQPPSAIPPPSQEPSAEPSATPLPSPSPAPVPTPRTFSAEIVDASGRAKSIVVVDESGLLENVFGGPVTDPDRPQNAEIEAVQVGADEGGGMDGIVLHWVDLSCPDDYRLTIGPTGREFILDGASCDADLLPVSHEVTLDFSEPIPAAEIDEQIVRS